MIPKRYSLIVLLSSPVVPAQIEVYSCEEDIEFMRVQARSHEYGRHTSKPYGCFSILPSSSFFNKCQNLCTFYVYVLKFM